MRDVLARLEETARRQSTSVRSVPGGFVLGNGNYPHAHDHHRVFSTAPVDADELADVADRELADAAHRLIYLHHLATVDEIAARLEPRKYGADLQVWPGQLHRRPDFVALGLVATFSRT